MKKIILLSSFSWIMLLAYGQEIVKETPLEIENPKDDIRLSGKELLPDPSKPELHYDNPYYRDPLEYPVPTGFENSVMRTLAEDFYFTISGRSEIWRGITTVNNATFDLHYNTDLLNITVGTSLWKYDGNRRAFGDADFHLNASVNPTEWLTLGVYGQYSVASVRNFEKHGGVLPTPMIPYSAFGVSSTIMFNSTFGIQGSFGRQFHPVGGKWETTYSIGPAIDLSRKKKKK